MRTPTSRRRRPHIAGGRPVWLFDLDNTLHHASHAIFPAINKGMTQYIIDGRIEHSVLLEILTEQPFGTMIRSH